MKQLVKLISIVSLMALAFSCSQYESEPADFEFSPESVTVSHKGGVSKISYTYRNPSAKAHFSAKCTADWIYGFDTSVDGEVSFITEVNKTGERRQNVVDVTCSAGNVTKSFLVIQKPANEEDQGDAIFGIEVITLFDNAIRYSVTREKGQGAYYCSVTEKSIFDSYKDENELFRKDLEKLRKDADKEGLSLEEYLKTTLNTGDKTEILCKDLKPGTEHYIYAYAMDYEGNAASGVSKAQAVTTSGGIINASFDISVEVQGPEAKMLIVPESNNFPYVFDIYPEKGLDESKLVDEYQKYIDELIVLYSQFGMTAEDVIKQIASIGPDSFSGELASDTRYVGFAIAITTSGKLNSEPTVEAFQTEAVGVSDNRIELNVTRTETRRIHFRLTTTNKDKYVLGIGEARLWDGMSDNEIIESIIRNTPNLSETALSGDIESYFSDLSPDTEYLIFAFGYYGSVPTTSLTKACVKTLETSDSDVTFGLEHDKFFDGDEVAAKYPQFQEAKGNAVLPAKVRTTGDVQGYRYHIFEGDWLDTSNPTDEDAIENLLQSGLTVPSKIFYVPYGKVCTLLGFSIDGNGNYGKVYRERILLEKKDASPVEEFVPESTPAVVFAGHADCCNTQANGIFCIKREITKK